MMPEAQARTRRRAAPALMVPALLAFTLLVFAPATVYNNNINEFSLSLITILNALLPFALATILASVVLLLLVPKRAYEVLLSIQLVLCALLLVQGMFLNRDYGSFDGSEIDWERFALTGAIETAAWGALILLGVWQSDRMTRAVTSISGWLASFQVALLVAYSLTSPDLWSAKRSMAFADRFNFS